MIISSGLLFWCCETAAGLQLYINMFVRGKKGVARPTTWRGSGSWSSGCRQTVKAADEGASGSAGGSDGDSDTVVKRVCVRVRCSFLPLRFEGRLQLWSKGGCCDTLSSCSKKRSGQEVNWAESAAESSSDRQQLHSWCSDPWVSFIHCLNLFNETVFFTGRVTRSSTKLCWIFEFF